MDVSTDPAPEDGRHGDPAVRAGGRPHARILVVIDERDVSHLVSSLLGAEGAEVRAVPTAAQAWGHLGEGGVDLVVMDLVLPDTDGRKFLMRLRERSDTAAIPVVMLSARDDSAIKSECFALGAEGFFSKPVDAEGLVSLVGALVRKSHGAPVREQGEDPVTGHLSRAGFLETMTGLPHETSVALVLIELDDFEEMGLRIGWSSVERVLGEAGSAFAGAIPAGASLARWEGAEFILLLEGASPEAARQAGESLLASARAHPWAEGNAGRPVTASVGVASGRAGDFLDGLLETARYRLFRARAAGGDRVEWERATGQVDPIHVLVAEDDPGTAMLLRARLEREGFELSIHENGSEALRAIQARRPDLVLLDVRMPGMDGFDVLSTLRADPERQDVPVIMITALGRESDLVRGFELGADDYMVKPFSPTELLARIHRLLGRKQARS